MTDLRALWQSEAAARANRAAAAVAKGDATDKQADRDAYLCDLIGRYLLINADYAQIMATNAALIDDLTAAARLLARIARTNRELSASALWANATVEQARYTLWNAHRAIGRVNGPTPPRDWRCAA